MTNAIEETKIEEQPTLPLPLLLAEELEPDWLEQRDSEIRAWKKEGAFKQWHLASNEIDWAIAERSSKRMDNAFDRLGELTGSPQYDVELQPYRNAKIILANERAFRQRVVPDAMSRKSINANYRAFTEVGLEIRDAAFAKEPDRQLSLLSEIVFLGTQMRMKKPLRFPYVSLPREESSPNGAYVNHDCYLFDRSSQSRLKKMPIQIKLQKTFIKEMHPHVENVNVLEAVRRVTNKFLDKVIVNESEKESEMESLCKTSAKKLYQLGVVAEMLRNEAFERRSSRDTRILNMITSQLDPLRKSR